MFAGVWLSSQSAFADIPDALIGEPIVDIEVQGPASSLVSPREMGVPIGAHLSRSLVRNVIRRLLEGGRWADAQVYVEPLSRGVRLIGYLTPRLFLTRIEVLGNDALDDDDILRRLNLRDGSELRPEVRDGIPEVLAEAYARRGYDDFSVNVVLRDTDDPSQKVLRLEIREGEPTRVEAIFFAGDGPPPRLRTARELGLSVGDVLDREEAAEGVERAQAYLREQGYLQAELTAPSYRRRASGGVAVVIGSRIGRHFEVRIRGGGQLRDRHIYEILDLGAERLTDAVLETMAGRVTDFCRRHGFRQARSQVIARRSTEDGEAFLDVTIDLGPRLDVTAIEFPGAEHFGASYLREQVVASLRDDLPIAEPFDAVDPHAMGELYGYDDERTRRLRRPLSVDAARVYYEPSYATAVDHVAELYRADGFLDVEVSEAELIELPENRARVVIRVNEGPKSTLFDVRVSGNHAISTHELLQASELTQGQPYSHLSLEQARVAMRERYRDEGYFFARVNARARFSGDRTRAEALFEITERFVVQVAEVVVRGNERTNASLIRNLVRFREGDRFRPSRARESQERLMELGIFSSVTVGLEEPELPVRLKRVVVTVSERLPQSLEMRGGISTGQGVRGALQYSYRNLFGYAVALTMRVELAHQFFFLQDILEDRYGSLSLVDRLERDVTLSLTMPSTPGLPRLRTSLDLVHLRDNQRDFGLDKNSGGLSFTYRPNRRWAVTLSETFEQNDVQLLVDKSYQELLQDTTDTRLQRLLRVPEGRSVLMATRVDLRVDYRDNPFTPRRGVFGLASLEWAKTLSSEAIDSGDGETERFSSNHLRLEVGASGYVPVNERVVFALQLRFGRVFHLNGNSQTYPNRRFFLGGVGTLRGFLLDSVIPQDLAEEVLSNPELDPTEVFRGGDVFMLARAELRFQIVGDFFGGFFCDAGNVWSRAAALDPSELRPATGLGLRYVTPFGPIALDYGFNLTRRKALGEPIGAFHFSIGLF